jgi:homoserine acetyltransferase
MSQVCFETLYCWPPWRGLLSAQEGRLRIASPEGFKLASEIFAITESATAPTVNSIRQAPMRLSTEVLHLNHLRAVLGIPGRHADEWKVMFPDFMDRAALIVATPHLMPFDVLLAAAEKSTLEHSDRNHYYRQLQTILGHGVFRPLAKATVRWWRSAPTSRSS